MNIYAEKKTDKLVASVGSTLKKTVQNLAGNEGISVSEWLDKYLRNRLIRSTLSKKRPIRLPAYPFIK